MEAYLEHYVISSIDYNNNDNHNTIQLQQCYSGAIIREPSTRCAHAYNGYYIIINYYNTLLIGFAKVQNKCFNVSTTI